MIGKKIYDAVVVGSGPNGLAAGIELCRAGRRVLLVEGSDTIGGGMRTASLTQPRYLSDVCSAVHPLAAFSPFFRQLPLEQNGVSWIVPDIALAHPFEDGSALFLHRSLEITKDALGADGKAYARIMSPMMRHYETLLSDLLAPPHIPRHPILTGRFALSGLRSAVGFAQSTFADPRSRALFAGLCAHAMVPLRQPSTAAFGLVLAGLAHTVGWPLICGGSQKLAQALGRCFTDLGGDIQTGLAVSSLADVPQADAYFFDVTPRQLLAIEGLGFSRHYRERLSRYRYGPGVFKIDWALREPIPWRAAICAKSPTIHLGHSLDAISESIERAVAGAADDPSYLIVGQPSLFDRTRAPEGRHVAWAYCHVPSGSNLDLTDAVEKRLERYAPGFRDIILARSSMTAEALEAYNPNYIGGDIGGGAADWRQLLTRPVASWNPYRTSQKKIYLCSASTPPGGGVHGLCGFYAVSKMLKEARS